ncbi:hypothetical protein D3C80_1467100 [compost metagenome]
MGGGIDLHVRPYHDRGADADRGVIQQGRPHVDVGIFPQADVAAIGAVERRADEGPLRQLADQRPQQDLLFCLLIGPVETTVQAGRLPAQGIQLGGHAVIGLAADHFLVVAHKWPPVGLAWLPADASSLPEWAPSAVGKDILRGYGREKSEPGLSLGILIQIRGCQGEPSRGGTENDKGTHGCPCRFRDLSALPAAP